MAQRKVARTEAGAVGERDLVRAYLDEIGRTPLLGAQQEVELAKDIEAGLYAAHLLDTHDASAAPAGAGPDELRRLAAAGQTAREEFLRSNLRLVVSVARRFTGRGLPLLDLIQEGNLGLVRAVEKFDYRRGFKFSTYATWWIRQAVGRAVAEQSRTIRVPVGVSEELAKLARARRDLVAVLDRDPTDGELAEALDTSAERVAQLRRWTRDPVSLDALVGEDEETTLGDFVGDTSNAANPEEVVLAAQDVARLRALLDDLEPRAAEILRWRYGLMDGRQHSLAEIGERCGLARESVRRIERQSLARLRALAGEHDLAA